MASSVFLALGVNTLKTERYDFYEQRCFQFTQILMRQMNVLRMKHKVGQK
jgi:hypothetical protein